MMTEGRRFNDCPPSYKVLVIYKEIEDALIR